MKNVNIKKMQDFMVEAKKDKEVLRKSMSVTVEWNMDEEKPQVSSSVAFPLGSQTLESDMAPFMGGWGRAPNPIQYCLFGMAACFASTFTSIAAEKNLEIDSFTATAENRVNLSQSLGMSDDPIVESVKISMEVKTSAEKAQVDSIKELALKRCPGIYCLTNPIPLEVSMDVS